MLLLYYSVNTPVIVIVIAALAEELLASVWLVVISLSGVSLSAREVLVSDTADADDPASITTSTTRAIRRISLFTISLSLYALFAWNRRLAKLEVV